MTKSRQSATRLRLSRLVRCLIALGCIKLVIMGVALLDLPMPSWGGQENAVSEKSGQPEHVAAANATIVEAVPEPEAATAANAEPLPVGTEAAELAAAAKPRRPQAAAKAILPAPLVSSGPVSPLGKTAHEPGIPLLPEPPALGAPLASAGVILPGNDGNAHRQNADNIWNILDLKSLPIPGLGSVGAAHAAALDMPVPPAPAHKSPFTPAEQLAPTAGQPTVLPGAPPLPANIPHGQGPTGEPLPPRYGAAGENGARAAGNFSAPAPNIPQRQHYANPNANVQDLARQQQDLLVLRQQMDQRLKDLQSAEDKMKDMIREAKDMEDKKVKNLVLMYANMKPRTAAQALENMDERVAVRILAGMAPKQSGEILTYTNHAKTAKFTEMLTRMRMTE